MHTGVPAPASVRAQRQSRQASVDTGSTPASPASAVNTPGTDASACTPVTDATTRSLDPDWVIVSDDLGVPWLYPVRKAVDQQSGVRAGAGASYLADDAVVLPGLGHRHRRDRRSLAVSGRARSRLARLEPNVRYRWKEEPALGGLFLTLLECLLS